MPPQRKQVMVPGGAIFFTFYHFLLFNFFSLLAFVTAMFSPLLAFMPAMLKKDTTSPKEVVGHKKIASSDNSTATAKAQNRYILEVNDWLFGQPDPRESS